MGPEQDWRMKTTLACAAAVVMTLATPTLAVEARGTRFWNLIGETVQHLHLAPVGTQNWGADQCLNDPDHSVDFDERLPIAGIVTGHYDIKLTDSSGRTCVIKDVAVKAGTVFAIDKVAWDSCRSP